MNLPDFVRHWSQEMGSSEEAVSQLKGGINNLVFSIGTKNRQWVVKGYPAKEAGKRDRMQAELELLIYANMVAPGMVPRLIEIDRDRRCLILEYVRGSSYTRGCSPTPEDVNTAIKFFRRLNDNHVLAKQMISMDAAEGFLSLRQHMSSVHERLSTMGAEHLPAKFRVSASILLVHLKEQADRLENTLETMITAGEVDDQIDPETRCVSPSDFGFHNAIRTDKGVTFIDFEFAGWDDPAKSYVDFILQPNVPIDYKTSSSTIRLLLNDCEPFNERVRILTQILQLKWLCIIMAILRPERVDYIKDIHREFDICSAIGSRLAEARIRLAAFGQLEF